MILIINLCKEKLHYFEFVKPIEDILQKNKINYFVKHYKTLSEKELNKSKKIIICGTSLQDNEFIKNIKKFNWIKKINKPIFGICAGMQIICLVFGGKLKNKTEIGYYNENFKKEFLGLKQKQQVYHLHNNYVSLPKNFTKYTLSDIPQAIKHNTKKIYSVLFHPEVRQKDLIIKFCRL